MCVCCVCVHMHVHGGQDSLQVLILTFYHVGSGDQTQVVSLGSKHIYPLSHINNFF